MGRLRLPLSGAKGLGTIAPILPRRVMLPSLVVESGAMKFTLLMVLSRSTPTRSHMRTAWMVSKCAGPRH